MLSKTSFVGLAMVLALGFALAAPTPASACGCYCDSLCGRLGDCCPWCPGGGQTELSAVVTPTGPGQAQITVNNAVTTSMVTGVDCITGMEEVRGMASVERIQLINVADGTLLYEFLPSEASTSSFNDLEATFPRPSAVESWSGFHGVVPRDIPDGTVAAFVIDVTLNEGVTVQNLARELRRHGSLAGGSGNEDGTLDFHHFFLRDFRNIPVAVNSSTEPKP
ncbi:MAG: hypothetical protein KDD47_09175 [Acidobacteria bacterium]|nr:hypothetical protein [Acidobacteriota bacterium]